MIVVKLCMCVIFLISIYFAQIYVICVDVDCVTLKNCSFASKILAQKRVDADIIAFLNSTKCGVENSTKEVKVWCPRFINCKTPDFRKGTCLPTSKCAEVTNVLNTMNIDQHRCYLPETTDVLICCPWPEIAEPNPLVKFPRRKQEGVRQRKRDVPFYPWSIPDQGNFYNNQNSQNFNFGFLRFGGQHFDANNNIMGNTFQKSLTSMQASLDEQTNWFKSVLLNNSKSIFNGSQENNNIFLNWWNQKSFGNNNVDGSKKDRTYNLTEETSFSAYEICLTPDNAEELSFLSVKTKINSRKVLQHSQIWSYHAGTKVTNHMNQFENSRAYQNVVRLWSCKEIRQCSTILNVLRIVNRTDFVEVNYLKKYQCPNAGRSDIKVCCSDNPIVLPDANVPSVEKVEKSERGGLLDSTSCGRPMIDDKIVGGDATGLAEFPWTALLQYTTPNASQFGCGGSIINKRYIVTAAHCVNSEILKQAGLQKLDKIILGEFDTRNETDCIYTRYGADCADPSQVFNVDRVIEHELFRFNDTRHDIALVKVDRDIIFSNYIMPICLPNQNTLRLIGNESFVIAGWGRTETGKVSPIKRKARLSYIDKVNCNQLGSLGDGQMCLGSGRGIDSCKGDSGGPVMNTIVTSGDVIFTLIGIISYGFGSCGTTTSVGTYVPFYLDWVLGHLV